MKVSVLTISHTAKANALQLYSSVQFTGWTPCCDHLRVCCVYRCQYLPTTAPALNSRSTGALEGIPVLGYIWDRSVSVFECECGHSSTSPPPAEHCWQNWSTHQSTPPCSRRPWNIPSLCQSSRNTAWTRHLYPATDPFLIYPLFPSFWNVSLLVNLLPTWTPITSYQHIIQLIITIIRQKLHFWPSAMMR